MREVVAHPIIREPRFQVETAESEWGTFISRDTFKWRLVSNLIQQGHEVLNIEVTPIVGTFIAIRFGALPTQKWLEKAVAAGIEFRHVGDDAAGGAHSILRLPISMYEDGVWVSTAGSMLGGEPIDVEEGQREIDRWWVAYMRRHDPKFAKASRVLRAIGRVGVGWP